MHSSKKLRISLMPCAATLMVLSACQVDPVISNLQPLNPQTTRTRVIQTARPTTAPQVHAPSQNLLDVSTQPAPAIPELAAQAQAASNAQPTAGTSSFSFSPEPASNAILNTMQRIPIETLQVAQDFDYASTQDVKTYIEVKTPNGNPYRSVAVAIYALNNDSKVAVTRGITDENGVFTQVVRVPSYHKALNFEVSAFGIANNRTLAIQNGQIQFTFGQ